MKKYFILFIFGLFAAAPALIYAGGPDEKETKAIIETAYGAIEIRFFPEAAPKHVENFIRLARQGFYDGTIFHKVIPGFKIQGGDPYTKVNWNTYTGCCPDKRKFGLGGPGWTIPAEFNNIPHRRGIVSMARFQDPDSAGSQFFIVVKDSNFLDGKFTAFGEVTSGMDVVDRITRLPLGRDLPNLPDERVEMKVRIKE